MSTNASKPGLRIHMCKSLAQKWYLRPWRNHLIQPPLPHCHQLISQVQNLSHKEAYSVTCAGSNDHFLAEATKLFPNPSPAMSSKISWEDNVQRERDEKGNKIYTFQPEC